jgi:hypothetical protein
VERRPSPLQGVEIGEEEAGRARCEHERFELERKLHWIDVREELPPPLSHAGLVGEPRQPHPAKLGALSRTGPEDAFHLCLHGRKEATTGEHVALEIAK